MLRDLAAFARSGPASLPDPAPLVTVIIPTYNYSSVLRHAIRSALRQTYPSFEVLVVGMDAPTTRRRWPPPSAIRA